jgi:hypothetical protein
MDTNIERNTITENIGTSGKDGLFYYELKLDISRLS